MLELRFIDRIWTTRGFVELNPPRSAKDTFARLDPLLKANGTAYEVDGNTLAYEKQNPAAQDKLATFTRGWLRVVQEGGKAQLHFTATSPALLVVFLAPLLFLAIAQMTMFIVEFERPTAEEKAAAEAEKEKGEEEKEPDPLNPIDAWLGAPAPETLEEKKLREEQEGKNEDEKHSPRPAYVFAGIFAFLFLVGRFLEPWLLRKNLREALNDPSARVHLASGDGTPARGSD